MINDDRIHEICSTAFEVDHLAGITGIFLVIGKRLLTDSDYPIQLLRGSTRYNGCHRDFWHNCKDFEDNNFEGLWEFTGEVTDQEAVDLGQVIAREGGWKQFIKPKMLATADNHPMRAFLG